MNNKRKYLITKTGRKFIFNSFDIEVYLNYWEVRSKDWYINSNDEFIPKNKNLIKHTINSLRQQLRNEIIVGYNIKHYDMIILYNILYVNSDVDFIFELSQQIIQHRGILQITYWNKFQFVDLIDFARNANDDKRIGLKSIAGHLNLSIIESEIDFDTHTITHENFNLHDMYLENDVVITDELMFAFEKLIDVKINIALQFNINEIRALKSTMTKLATLILYNKNKTEYTNDVYYKIPEKLKDYIYEHVDINVINYFTGTKMCDLETLEYNAFNNKGKFGKGGFHSVLDDNIYVETSVNMIVGHDDWVSFYPNLMILFDLLSRKANKELYIKLYNERIKIKKELGYTQDDFVKRRIYETYKEIINAIFGASGDKYSLIYDPENITSVTITGQLLVAAVANHMHKNGIEIIQSNTDGIVNICTPELLSVRQQICDEVSKITGIEFESENITKFIQFNVNNYIEVDGDTITTKGAVVKNFRGNDMFTTVYPIEQRAIVDYFVNGIDIEATIRNSKNIKNYSMICNIGKTYNNSYFGTFDMISRQDVQKINRIINIKPELHEENNKKIWKKKPNGNPEKVARQGENIVIINDNLENYDINDYNIDYDFHIENVKEKIKKVRKYNGK